MNYRSRRITSYAIILLFATTQINWANSLTIEKKFREDFSVAQKYIRASYTDSAKVILSRLLQQLSDRQEMDTDFGLSVRLHYADLLIRERSDVASRQLTELIKIAADRQAWETVAHCHVLLAMIHETLGAKETCESHLDRAALLIKEHHLAGLYARYAIGRSSYYRVFNLNRDSALFYAREALRTVQIKPSESQAAAYFLVGLLLEDSSYTRQIDYLEKAAEVYLELGDYFGHTSMINIIADNYFHHRQLDSALVYSDSALLILKRLEANRFDYYGIKSSTYKIRANLYKALGRLDDAWQYMEESHRARLEYDARLRTKDIAEVEERYKDEQKIQQLEQQAQQIKFEIMRRNGALALALLIVLFAVILSFFYSRLFNVNRKNRAQAERLANLDQAKSRFFANVSHELRTPLTLLLGPIESLLKDNRLAPREQEFLLLAHKNGRQLEQLVNEILDLQKLEKGKLELHLQPTRLPHFFLPYLAQFESLAQHRSIRFHNRIALEEPGAVLIDREKCRQILYNLLSNAFKYTPKGGAINVKLTIDRALLRIRVADSGPGIHPDDLPYLFDRYFQTNRPDRPAEGGTGIGLSLGREYARLMQGDIEVKSQLGAGAVFTVSIPVEFADNDSEVSPPAPITSYHRAPAKNAQGDKPLILLVEDNSDLQAYLQMILSTQYRITTAQNGQEAMQLLTASNHYELIISDLMMPVMDGYQLLEKIKSDDATRHLPFIMLTARADVRDKLKALRLGVDDYLLKPFHEEELKVRISNLLQNQQIRLEAIQKESPDGEISLLLSETDRQWLETFEQYIRDNLGNDILSVDVIANEFAMSVSSLHRQIKRLNGLTPGQYLREARLDQARYSLENRICSSVEQAAREVGYNDFRSFSRSFKKRFGKLPSKI